jgi:hypothetical protein
MMLENCYPCLEQEVGNSEELMEKLISRDYAQKFYSSLCNTQWKKEGFVYDKEIEPWGVNYGTASSITSHFHHQDSRLAEDLEFYMSGGEEDSEVDPEVEKDLLELGWTHEPTSELV